MRKKWIIIALICVVGLGGAIICSFIPRITEHTESQTTQQFTPFAIEYTMVGSSEYDPSYYYNNYDLIKDSPITDFHVINGDEQFKEQAEQNKFSMPTALDCEEYYYVATYGRKMVDLRVESMNGDYYMPEITFEEVRQGNQVFFYQIDKPYIYIFNWPCYIMQGEDRVYMGDVWTALNEFDPEGKRL